MFIGLVRRRCSEDGKWDDEFVECLREAAELFNQVAYLRTYVLNLIIDIDITFRLQISIHL